MHIAQNFVPSLPKWTQSNRVEFFDTVASSATPGNYRIRTTKALTSANTVDNSTLLRVPKDLILDREYLLAMERVDPHFKQLKELVGGTSIRKDMMLFLLLQLTIVRSNLYVCTNCYAEKVDCLEFHKNANGKCENCNLSGEECILLTLESQSGNLKVGVKNPWSEYVRFLPTPVPIPTMWSSAERRLLSGTTLEPPTYKKICMLFLEFEDLRRKTVGIPWCRSSWWAGGLIKQLGLHDWIQLDAWYRSQTVELPNTGRAMVPCLNMANHSSNHNAYWDQTSNGDVSLVLRPNTQLNQGTEITINYGDSKSDAENIFNYGFIDGPKNTASLIVCLHPMVSLPLYHEKHAAFAIEPTITFSRDEDGTISWKSPFLYFACLNEEDGLEFENSQEIDGEHSSLKVFWQGIDVTEYVQDFETLIRGHELLDVFMLRVITLIIEKVRCQLEHLLDIQLAVELGTIDVAQDIRGPLLEFRRREMKFLADALEIVTKQKFDLQQRQCISNTRINADQ